MGCGLVTQRGIAVEVHHPLTQEAHVGTRIHSIRIGGGDGSSGPRSPGSPGSSGEHSSRQGSARGEREGDGRGFSRGPPRRFVLGEHVLMSSRVPNNISDHAFCFECGVFFQLGNQRAPQCGSCGSSFIQFLRGHGSQNWISASSERGTSYTFDDQMDNSMSASMEEAPAHRKPTQVAFLKGLPSIHIKEEEQVEARAAYGTADPRCSCSICRDVFSVGDTLKQMPCNHEFHETCIITWLRSNNTCPICRWRCPEAVEGEEEDEQDEEDVLRLKQQDSHHECGAGDRQVHGVHGLPTIASEDEEAEDSREHVDSGGGAALSEEVSSPA